MESILLSLCNSIFVFNAVVVILPNLIISRYVVAELQRVTRL